MRRPVLIVIDMVNDFFTDVEVSQREQLVKSINDPRSPLSSLGSSCGLGTAGVRTRPARCLPRNESQADLHQHQGDTRLPDPSRLITRPVRPGHRQEALQRVLRLRPRCASRSTAPGYDRSRRDQHPCLHPDDGDRRLPACDWPVVLASDCTSSYDLEHHEITLKYMKDKIATVLTNDELGIALRSGT